MLENKEFEIMYSRNGFRQDFFDPTGKFQNLRRGF